MFNWLQHLFTARALQQELAASKEQVALLKQENAALESELDVLKKKIQPIQHSGRLEELKEQMLVLIAKQDGITEPSIINMLNINAQLAKFHLQELSIAGLAAPTLNMAGGPGRWSLMQEGRRYLAAHGLLA